VQAGLDAIQHRDPRARSESIGTEALAQEVRRLEAVIDALKVLIIPEPEPQVIHATSSGE
jgi:hypothetical protein